MNNMSFLDDNRGKEVSKIYSLSYDKLKEECSMQVAKKTCATTIDKKLTIIFILV